MWKLLKLHFDEHFIFAHKPDNEIHEKVVGVSLISCYTRIIKISESIIYSERVQTIIRDVQLFSEKEKEVDVF